MFESTKDRYLTRGIAREIPMDLQIFLWGIIEREKTRHEMDYLQVFRLEIDGEGNLHVHYDQERPEHHRTYSLAMVGADMPEVDGKKIYVIDDETHVTMLLAEEY